MAKRRSKYSVQESIGTLAYQTSGAIRKRIGFELARKGYPFGAEQFTALIYVWDADGEPQRVLAERLYRDKSTVTRLVTQIEEMGFVERVPGKQDTREKRIFLTPKGKKLMEGVIHLVQGVLQLATKGVEEDELNLCKDVLRRIRANLNEPR